MSRSHSRNSNAPRGRGQARGRGRGGHRGQSHFPSVPQSWNPAADLTPFPQLNPFLWSGHFPRQRWK